MVVEPVNLDQFSYKHYNNNLYKDDDGESKPFRTLQRVRDGASLISIRKMLKITPELHAQSIKCFPEYFASKL